MPDPYWPIGGYRAMLHLALRSITRQSTASVWRIRGFIRGQETSTAIVRFAKAVHSQ
jgi:hypothetical protein